MTRMTRIALAGGVGALMLAGCAQDEGQISETGSMSGAAAADAGESGLLHRAMTRLDGSSQDLWAYRGKVVLVVNVASKCGLTPQYEGLESLYEAKRGEGLVILGFPANNFGGQEPGTDAEIGEFCELNYAITFPMFSKISVKGEDQHELFAELSAQSEEPSWNFTKYLIDRNGSLVERFDPRTKPDDERLVGRIDELLGEE